MTFERIQAIGLIDSKQAFSVQWLGRGEDLMRDYTRRDGATARVSPSTVLRLRSRLAEAANLLPADLAAEVHDIDAGIERDLRVADLLGRHSVR